ncbi:MAG: signal peptidase I [Candidatus Schekmanbacteria bacterium RIFCSPHIGHO2_02_FULL_38_11]|uniref:Signal peptidase I n=1 Tax=Candidatus Schekmanbacteria bacterium RIFCSPLOWO2_12_FULL_38_15 TaxID=1817883 RepID=A0A1F7SEF8_9BACT|nr:MAG: signal peptidase I [Candidatus Schekmanbacteria bacterium GWA2_38_9]OGL48962.1 MAG: signal peptidase I [Candidatus Schekmanbacteria bacterium RIFCSPHIGHO2_02_FULL_38_11]OGL49115.1 MAG: signal peptidase I [Candidatus Schekmanbacteria bacterium RIFCSPLOWO2_02_FULL_38_14]OGL52091.1 MAG: signal peptidase I [Candidatus Schekmanbacteria bacterium RIFCSPLOWO2_12_FULL_38_15]
MQEKWFGSPAFRELSSEILRKGHVLRFQARGTSMHPFIKDKDIIKVKPVQPEKLKSGDVILYKTGYRGFVVHRLIKKQNKKKGEPLFVTKGDFCYTPDPAISSSDILGKVISIERNGKEISMENGMARLRNFLLSKASPFSFILYPIGRKVKKIGLAILKK